MALLAGIRQSFASYVSPHKPHPTDRLLTPPPSEHSPELDLQIAPDHTTTSEIDANLEGDTLVASTSKSRKRPFEGSTLRATIRKKRKTVDHAFLPEDDSSSDFEGAILETSTPPPVRTKNKQITTKEAADRALMPPPATPTNQERRHASPKDLV